MTVLAFQTVAILLFAHLSFVSASRHYTITMSGTVTARRCQDNRRALATTMHRKTRTMPPPIIRVRGVRTADFNPQKFHDPWAIRRPPCRVLNVEVSGTCAAYITSQTRAQKCFRPTFSEVAAGWHELHYFDNSNYCLGAGCIG